MPATPRAAFSRSAALSPRTRNTVTLAGEWLANTTMGKPLPPHEGASNETRGLAVSSATGFITWSSNTRVIAAAVVVGLYIVYRLYSG